tara:strand:- start:178 stop:567 length:390 start_codon:yes stop_codon:yes gene_type:complete
MNNINLILPGLIIGVIVYQTMFVAPTVFQTIDSKNTSKFLRKIFPKFFILIFILSALAILEAYYNSRGNTFYVIYMITSLFSILAFSLIPMTNKATDDNDKKKFKILHSLSVLLTIIILIINFIPFFKH